MNLKSIIDKDKSDNKDENQDSCKETAKVRTILAELGGHAPGTGTIKMAVLSSKAVEEKSISSINNAMLLIKEFSKMVADTVEEVSLERGGPSQIQMGFNILFTTDGKAVITKSDRDANLRIVMTWKHEEDGKKETC